MRKYKKGEKNIINQIKQVVNQLISLHSVHVGLLF